MSLHAVQLLPALAWLLFTGGGRRTRVMVVAAAGYLGLFAVTVVQTFSGVPTLELAAGVAVLLVASVLALAGPFVVTMWELARAPAWDAANGRAGSWLTRRGRHFEPSWMGSHSAESASLVVAARCRPHVSPPASTRLGLWRPGWTAHPT